MRVCEFFALEDNVVLKNTVKAQSHELIASSSVKNILRYGLLSVNYKKVRKVNTYNFLHL